MLNVDSDVQINSPPKSAKISFHVSDDDDDDVFQPPTKQSSKTFKKPRSIEIKAYDLEIEDEIVEIQEHEKTVKKGKKKTAPKKKIKEVDLEKEKKKCHIFIFDSLAKTHPSAIRKISSLGLFNLDTYEKKRETNSISQLQQFQERRKALSRPLLMRVILIQKFQSSLISMIAVYIY